MGRELTHKATEDGDNHNLGGAGFDRKHCHIRNENKVSDCARELHFEQESNELKCDYTAKTRKKSNTDAADDDRQAAKSSAEVSQGDRLNNWTGPNVKKVSTTIRCDVQ
jgi:hypothetical protein